MLRTRLLLAALLLSFFLVSSPSLDQKQPVPLPWDTAKRLSQSSGGSSSSGNFWRTDVVDTAAANGDTIVTFDNSYPAVLIIFLLRGG